MFGTRPLPVILLAPAVCRSITSGSISYFFDWLSVPTALWAIKTHTYTHTSNALLWGREKTIANWVSKRKKSIEPSETSADSYCSWASERNTSSVLIIETTGPSDVHWECARCTCAEWRHREAYFRISLDRVRGPVSRNYLKAYVTAFESLLWQQVSSYI